MPLSILHVTCIWIALETMVREAYIGFLYLASYVFKLMLIPCHDDIAIQNNITVSYVDLSIKDLSITFEVMHELLHSREGFA